MNFKYFLITLQSVTLGTFFGFFLAIITGYFSATNIHKHKIFSIILKVILMLLRAFPVIVFILLFKNAFSAQLASFTLYFWFTWLWMNRYISDLIESSDTKVYYRDIYLGKNKIASFYKNIYLQVRIKFFLNFFIAYESNIRWVAILGLVGINGLGIFFSNPRIYKDSFGITLLFIALFILLIEIILFSLNKVLLVQKEIKPANKKDIYSFKYNWKKYVLILMLMCYFAILIWGFISLSNSEIYWTTLNKYFSSIFKFDFSDFNISLLAQYWIIIQQAFLSIVIGYIFAVFYSYVLSEKINKTYNVLAFKSLLTLIKVIPTFFWFLIFNPIMDQTTAITIALIVSAFRKLTKQVTESINTIPLHIIIMYKSKGWNKLKIYRWYILPYVNKQLISVFIFQSEDSIRSAINYGAFANIGIYNTVLKYQENGDYNKIFPIILPAYILFILIEITFWLSKEKNIFKFERQPKIYQLAKISHKYSKFYKKLKTSNKRIK
ncbi:hypothetical protein SAM46_01095 [Mycoplasmopsis verecunda]|uniref:hypothetical protein n=1 Tax=Mycoplasmopsis verecunda TaxID=171291 RepID=UPI00298BEF74|nr:hypothetical protein [Mycoplasmopsis verecunda]WPB54737.1 hypothetical protein SAM46_01095 [Mycoplasmopsis verecunda]